MIDDKRLQMIAQMSLVAVRDACANEELSADEMSDVAKSLAGRAAHLARLASYLDTRHCAGHKEAVDRQNAVARQVRKALGHYHTLDITF